MKVRTLTGTMRAVLSVVLLGGINLAAGLPPASAEAKSPFTVAGTYVEGCSCSAPCPCQLTGVAHGCNGVGAITLTSGSYRGVALNGVKIAYATVPGEWVRLYVDVRDPQQQE